MAEIIGVKFKDNGKLYYFQPNDEYLLTGTKVIVETSRGTECGEVVMERRTVPDEQITHELKKVIRAATADDMRRVEENHAKEETAFGICEKKILDHRLDMKLVSVEYAFDGSKILFCFTADGRVDFRELVKDLASVFHTRIELRQIGVRDEAKMLGGLGICGRPFCCSSFLGDFIPVSIKMAKEQGLSLNPVKISGACGRLMCCLKYEEEAYHDLIKHTPKVGMHVNTPDGKGTVCEVNLITGNLRIAMDNMPEAAPRTFNKKNVSALGDTNELSAAEAAMFSSYVKEEEVGMSDEEKMELERMIEDDGVAPDERPSDSRRRQRQDRPRREQNRRDQQQPEQQAAGQHTVGQYTAGQEPQGGRNRRGGGPKQGRPEDSRERQPDRNARGPQNKGDRPNHEKTSRGSQQNGRPNGNKQQKLQKGQHNQQSRQGQQNQQNRQAQQGQQNQQNQQNRQGQHGQHGQQNQQGRPNGRNPGHRGGQNNRQRGPQNGGRNPDRGQPRGGEDQKQPGSE